MTPEAQSELCKVAHGREYSFLTLQSPANALKLEIWLLILACLAVNNIAHKCPQSLGNAATVLDSVAPWGSTIHRSSALCVEKSFHLF